LYEQYSGIAFLRFSTLLRLIDNGMKFK